jgi:hypothetical protein
MGSQNRSACNALAMHRAAFLTIMPRIEMHARFAFRLLRCTHDRSDAVAEVVALCWMWFRRLANRGKDATTFSTTLASFASRQVKCGRLLNGQENSKDVLSATARQRHGFDVSRLPDSIGKHEAFWCEALTDNTRSPIPEQVAFRHDFPSWLTTLSQRERSIIEDLTLGHRTLDLANKYGISPGRISQLRRVFERGWALFCDETPEADVPFSTAAM